MMSFEPKCPGALRWGSLFLIIQIGAKPMGLKYENLDAETRRYMLEEIALDAQNESFYLSSYLSQTGQGDWQEILTEAVVSGTDDSFAITLRQRGRLNQFAQRRRPRGAGYTTYRVPVTAHETLAEGEFNRYFVRGLCRRAIAEGIARLEVYRAKEVEVPRAESREKIGLLMDPEVVLIDVRASVGVDTALGMPQGPNSGLTLRIPRDQR
jgi:hypothetical protein